MSYDPVRGERGQVRLAMNALSAISLETPLVEPGRLHWFWTQMGLAPMSTSPFVILILLPSNVR